MLFGTVVDDVRLWWAAAAEWTWRCSVLALRCTRHTSHRRLVDTSRLNSLYRQVCNTSNNNNSLVLRSYVPHQPRWTLTRFTEELLINCHFYHAHNPLTTSIHYEVSNCCAFLIHTPTYEISLVLSLACVQKDEHNSRHNSTRSFQQIANHGRTMPPSLY